MHRKGFALFEIAIVLGIIALLAGGGLYFSGLQNQKSAVEISNDTPQKDKELQQRSQTQTNEQHNVIN